MAVVVRCAFVRVPRKIRVSVIVLARGRTVMGVPVVQSTMVAFVAMLVVVRVLVLVGVGMAMHDIAMGMNVVVNVLVRMRMRVGMRRDWGVLGRHCGLAAAPYSACGESSATAAATSSSPAAASTATRSSLLAPRQGNDMKF